MKRQYAVFSFISALCETRWQENNRSHELTFFRVHIKFLSSYAHLFGFTILLALLLPVEGVQLGHHLAELIFELLKQIKINYFILLDGAYYRKAVKLIPFDRHNILRKSYWGLFFVLHTPKAAG